jgi:hypothetical protein
MMRRVFMLALACASTLAIAGNVDKQCNIATCEAGTKVKSYSTQSEPYFACQTKELSEYTNYVLGLLAFSKMISGHLPNVSPITGDPEQEGKSKVTLDQLRSTAKVQTFDQALTMCERGRNGIQLLVANNPKDSQSIWVFDPKRNLNYWVSKSHMDKQ